MKKTFAITALIIMAIVFVVGLFLIFSSFGIGEKAGYAIIQSHGGTFDTKQYERVINTTTTNFQIVGAILSLTGGFGILLSGFAIYKEL